MSAKKKNQKEKLFFPVVLRGQAPVQGRELSEEYESFRKVKLHINIVCLASQQRASSTHEKFSFYTAVKSVRTLSFKVTTKTSLGFESEEEHLK